LANASLDLAFHDKLRKDSDYIKKFWVGLMDGVGSIQVNHWRKTNLQYRLVIKLKYDENNVSMFNKIKESIGGKVVISKAKEYKYIVWVVDDRKKILNIIDVFNKYPPITFRLNAQLLFMKNCLVNNNIDMYFEKRKDKYISENIWNPKLNCDYFNEWLSGFIEAEGCFCIRQNKNHSFSISQKNENVLVEYIKKYFEIQTKVRNVGKDVWLLETYRKSTLLNVIKHCDNYPLLGQKMVSFDKFIKEIFKL